MVRVPIYEPSVQLRPAFRQDVDVRATPEAFGSDIGAGLQQLGRGAGQASDAMAQLQEFENATRAKEADNQFAAWARERMYGDGGYMTLAGRNAVDGRKAFEDEAAAKRLEFGEGLQGSAAQHYKDASTARLNQLLQTSIVHSAQERKQWFADASTARLDTFSEDAVAAFDNPAKVDFNIAAGQAEIRQQAQLMGWDADTTANREAEYVSTVRLNTALRMLADDPKRAKTYYETHKGQFTGAHQFKFEEALKVPLTKANVETNVATFFGSPAVPSAGDAAAVIRGFEGFRSTPYWDVNAYRVGFGSDTITKADGTVARVTPGMVVTEADAARDLQRRLNSEFVPGIVRMVGQDKWDAMPAPAKAALASVAYNYGSLPFTVANAVISGDVARVADTIEALGGHNDGVSAGRRASEAAMVRGLSGVPASAAAASPGFGDVETFLAGIADPTERDLTRKAIYAQMEAQQKAIKAQHDAYQSQAFNLIETQNISPFDLPDEITTSIGMEGMSALMTYWDKRQAGTLVTDPVIFHDLQMAYATNPTEFAKRDMFAYKNVLSKEDWRTVTGWQQTALTDERKAREDGLNLSAAFSAASTALDAVGISTVGKEGNDRQRAAEQIARFNAALADQMEAFKRANDGRNPSQADVQAMVNRLLLPVVIKGPPDTTSFLGNHLFGIPLGGGSQTSTFLFDAGAVGDLGNGVTSELDVKYADIPLNERVAIEAHLADGLGRQPSEDQVVAVYEQFLLSRFPASPPTDADIAAAGKRFAAAVNMPDQSMLRGIFEGAVRGNGYGR